MTGALWAVLVAAFLASTVEFVEAFTIVLVVGITVNWRSAFLGTLAAIGVLAVIVGIFGTALVIFVPITILQLAVGVLLVLFGLKWLKKAVLRYSGLKALHDEEAIYEERLAEMRARGEHPSVRVDPFGVVTSFKSVLLEGLEVAFIVITFGSQASGSQASSQAGGNGIFVAALGAAAALLLVVTVGGLVQAPLQRVPENTLKFMVGIMLTSFGTFWGGEGLGIIWWHQDVFLPILVVFYLGISGILVLWLKASAPSAHSVTGALQPRSQEIIG